jgi:hypothetical protein
LFSSSLHVQPNFFASLLRLATVAHPPPPFLLTEESSSTRSNVNSSWSFDLSSSYAPFEAVFPSAGN